MPTTSEPEEDAGLLVRADRARRASAPVNGTEAAARVADVLVTVGGHPGPVGVTELSRMLGLGKSVVHRILQTLEDRALIRPVSGYPGKYTLGGVALAWGALPTVRRELTAAAAPALHSLFEECRQTVTVSLLVGVQRYYVGQVPVSGSAVQLDLAFPLYAGSSGKAMLAFAPRALRNHVLGRGLRPLTDRTPTDARRLSEQLVHVRRTRIAVSVAEVKAGIGSVASPIFSGGQVVGAISVCVPAGSFDSARARELAEVVRPTACRVSAAMGSSLEGLH